MVTTARYSARAARALGYLNANRNEVEIYVEDTSAPNLWLKLLKNYFPNHVQLESVNLLGSRTMVVEACRADQERDGRKKLYIIDGDLDLLIGKEKPRLRYLYRLRGYCVENYLLSNEAMAAAVTSVDALAPMRSARQMIDLEGWIARNGNLLVGLFICYAVVYELRAEMGTVSYSVHRLIDQGSRQYDLCARKVGARVFELYKAVREKKGKAETRAAVDKARTNAAKLGAKRLVSAKDYIIPVLFELVRANFKVGVSRRSFQVLVAANVKDMSDGYLKKRCWEMIDR